mmetsp:Transcript_5682/g.8064  ORF Transcript_5682/g.8064 Transcript_5682/m.8064 type:complete len:369 (-) Transcript_5682:138-1244(-)
MGRGSSSSNEKRSKSRRVKLMEQSGLTDADRRQLRHQQRSLAKKIINNTEAMENPDEEAFSAIRSENNELFDKVAYTREAVLDSENFDMITSRAARQVDRLVQVATYDPIKFSQKLASKCTTKVGSNSSFNWLLLGKEAVVCYNSVPSRVNFLAGPLQADYTPKERKKPVRRAKDASDDEEEERPEDLKTQKKDGDQLSAVETNMKVLSKTLKKRCRQSEKENVAKFEQMEFSNEEERKRAVKRFKRHGSDINAIQYLMNPKSFTQTVENIFHFSFLVKNSKAKIAVDEGGSDIGALPGPVVQPMGEIESTGPPRQAVVAFTMQDWKELCKAYEVEQGDIPNRARSAKYTKQETAVAVAKSSQEEDGE